MHPPPLARGGKRFYRNAIVIVSTSPNLTLHTPSSHKSNNPTLHPSQHPKIIEHLFFTLPAYAPAKNPQNPVNSHPCAKSNKSHAASIHKKQSVNTSPKNLASPQNPVIAYNPSEKVRQAKTNEKDVIIILKRKFISMTLIALIGLNAVPAFAADDTTVVEEETTAAQSHITNALDKQDKNTYSQYVLSHKSINDQGTLYLPLRDTITQMGGTLLTNPDKQTDKIKLTTPDGDKELYYNKKHTALGLTANGHKQPIKMVDGTTYVPMALIQSLTNRTVSVMDSTLVLINTDATAPMWKALTTYTIDPAYVQKSKREQITSTALKYLGVPYVWGGTTPAGFDCSGFVQYVYKECGISLPRVADAQQAYAKPISTANLQPGDLVFWGYGAYHVGIYLGQGKYVHAPAPGQTVKIQSVYEYAYTGAGTVL